LKPGGSKIISPYLGKDMTRAFDSDLHQHSEYSKDILENFQIGVVKGNTSFVEKEKKITKREKLRKEANVQLDKPIFLQVGKLGEIYDEWVHIPVIPGKETDHIYMFQDNVNGFFEIHSYVKWWFVPLVHGKRKPKYSTQSSNQSRLLLLWTQRNQRPHVHVKVLHFWSLLVEFP
jgi:hypothetical protein